VILTERRAAPSKKKRRRGEQECVPAAAASVGGEGISVRGIFKEKLGEKERSVGGRRKRGADGLGKGRANY
jgi:hypothetical protein